MTIESALKILQGRVGTKVGNGMCGSLASQMLEYVAGYSFDGEEQGANDDNSIEPFAPGADMTSSWSVYTTTHWSEIGYDYINRPANSMLQSGDIFFISPEQSGIWSGHSGIVLSNVNGVVTTLEQNIDSDGDGVGEPWVHQFRSDTGKGSIAWFGSVDGVVRKREQQNINEDKNNPKGDEQDMKIISITTDAEYYGKQYKAGACFNLTGDSIRYIERPQALEQLQAIGIPFYKMSGVQFLLIIQDLNLKIS